MLTKALVVKAYPGDGETYWDSLQFIKTLPPGPIRDAAVKLHRIWSNPVRKRNGRKPRT